jgi:hypothetical protein
MAGKVHPHLVLCDTSLFSAGLIEQVLKKYVSPPSVISLEELRSVPQSKQLRIFGVQGPSGAYSIEQAPKPFWVAGEGKGGYTSYMAY